MLLSFALILMMRKLDLLTADNAIQGKKNGNLKPAESVVDIPFQPSCH
jgi:hypothetical protein